MKPVRCFIAWLIGATGLLPISGCYAPQSLRQSSSTLYTEGRIITTDSGSIRIFWPGTSIQARFEGSEVRMRLYDDAGRNHFAVIIDDTFHHSFRADKGEKEYLLASALPAGRHRVAIYKMTDWFDGESVFYGYKFPYGKPVAETRKPRYQLEFYGNSITVGAGMLTRSHPLYAGSSTNNYRSYGALTARHFNASARFIASSGIGLMVSWGSLIMPEIYDRCNPADSSSRWNFSSYQPDVVIVNLLQNDYALLQQKNNSQFIRRFGSASPAADTIVGRYAGFIAQIRAHYPDAYILCCLGSMSAVRPESPFPAYIRTAVASLNDQNIGTHFFRPVAGNEHPTPEEHEIMARELIQVLTPILSKR